MWSWFNGALGLGRTECVVRRWPIGVRDNAYVHARPAAAVWSFGLNGAGARGGQLVITDGDVRALLDVVDRCRPAAATDDIFYAGVLAGLRELIPCDEIAFTLMDVGEQRVRGLFVTDSGVDREEAVGSYDEWSTVLWKHFWEDHGCAGPLKSGDYTTLLDYTEMSRSRAYANSAVGTLLAESGLKGELLVPMTPIGGTERRLLLWRTAEEPDFSDREKAMLRLVRPHLVELHTRRERELRGEPNLTPRQWEVLRQVATGASNTQIARTLGLSDATVRKHLENVYLRLGVQSRTEALARVRAFLDAA